MLKTMIHPLHVEAGARMVEYAGWDMPLYYGPGATEEHRIVRRSAGLFDVSHMGRFRIIGKEAGDYLNHMISSDVCSLAPGESGYGLLLREDGGILDDVFLYCLAPDEYILVVNAANLHKDRDWLVAHGGHFNMEFSDESGKTSLFALQGPRVIPVLEEITGEDFSGWNRFAIRHLSLRGIPIMAGRTGYTGEDGVEIFVDNSGAIRLWTAILEEFGSRCEIAPCGLASRDSLRFEPGFPLYGHELGEDIRPPEALLKWACHMDGSFIGRDAVAELLETGLERKLATLSLLEKGVPREGYEVLSPEGAVIGKVVSGLYAPSLDKYCANAYLPPSYTRAGTELGISLRGRVKRAVVEKRPLYRPAYR